MTMNDLGLRWGLVGGKAANQAPSTLKMKESPSF